MLNREIDYREIPSISVSGDYDTDDTAIVQEEIDEDDDENDGMDDGELADSFLVDFIISIFLQILYLNPRRAKTG